MCLNIFVLGKLLTSHANTCGIVCKDTPLPEFFFYTHLEEFLFWIEGHFKYLCHLHFILLPKGIVTNLLIEIFYSSEYWNRWNYKPVCCILSVSRMGRKNGYLSLVYRDFTHWNHLEIDSTVLLENENYAW